MSKTTPEEAKALAAKHGHQFVTGDKALWFSTSELVALIDEVRSEKALEYVSLFGELQNALEEIERLRGVDAEPVAHGATALGMQYREYFPRAEGGARWGYWYDCEKGYSIEKLKNPNERQHRYLYARPAPSQPAAPVELPVVAWQQAANELLRLLALRDSAGGVHAYELDLMRATKAMKDLLPKEKSKLPDAQAAIAAGRKVS